jgi:hypothetical protein
MNVRSEEESDAIIYDETEIGAIIRGLNHKCREAGKSGNYEEAKRLANLAGCAEDALLEYRKTITQ